MKNDTIGKNEKNLNRLSSGNTDMKRGARSSKSKEEELAESIEEAQKDPKFFQEINRFIRATTSVHKLC